MWLRGVTWGLTQSAFATASHGARVGLLALVVLLPMTGLPGTANAEAGAPAYVLWQASNHELPERILTRDPHNLPRSAATMVLGGQAANVTVDDSLTTEWQSVDDASLNAMRGGFDLGGGMSIAFGLTRTVTINGKLLTTTSIQIPDISQLTSNQSAALTSHLGTVQIVQNGVLTNTEGALRLASATGATVIQNSLNNQSIKSLTTIDANVGSLSLLKAFNTQSAIRDALINAITSR